MENCKGGAGVKLACSPLVETGITAGIETEGDTGIYKDANHSKAENS